MRNYIKDLFRTFTLLTSSVILLILGLTVYALTFPTGTPAGETPSGIFAETLNKLLARTEYSKDCLNYLEKGWSSKANCLQDGRWHLVQTTTTSSYSHSSELASAINNGADIRVAGINASNVKTVRLCSAAFVYQNYAYCNRPLAFGGGLLDGSPLSWSSLGGSLIRSDGKSKGISSYKEGKYNLSDATDWNSYSNSIEWYVRY